MIDYVNEVLLLQMFGSGKHLSAVMWYVSALLIVSILVYYLLVKNKKLFSYIIAPISALLIYSYFYQSRGMLGGGGLEQTLDRSGWILARMGRDLLGLRCLQYIYIYMQRHLQRSPESIVY